VRSVICFRSWDHTTVRFDLVCDYESFQFLEGPDLFGSEISILRAVVMKCGLSACHARRNYVLPALFARTPVMQIDRDSALVRALVPGEAASGMPHR